MLYQHINQSMAPHKHDAVRVTYEQQALLYFSMVGVDVRNAVGEWCSRN